MGLNPDWIPLLWPASPVEAAAGYWHEPASLGIVKGTPVNCLVVQWAMGRPEDGQRQLSLTPLVAAGKAAGLAFVGLVAAGADKATAATAAEAAGVAALAVEGEAPPSTLPVIPWAGENKVPWTSVSPILVVDGVRWPGITMGSTHESEDVNASATQAPWIDSNTYYLQMAAARAGAGKTFWLMFEPPGKGRVITRDSYLRAVADSGMAGGRWLLSLDDHLRSGLAQGKPEAVETWRDIASAAGFFAKHGDWRGARPAGRLGVISDFTGPNADLGSEILNLLARRNLPFRVIAKTGRSVPAFEGLKAVCCLDENPQQGALRTQCEDFVEDGGLLFVSRGWGAGGTVEQFEHPRFEMRRLGRGRLAVSKEESPDPYLVARDVHVLLDRTNDLVRFFNISSLISHYTTLPADAGLLQFVNYARRAPDDVITVWLHRPYRSARLWTLGAASARPVPVTPENGGSAVHLPSLPVYGAVELSP